MDSRTLFPDFLEQPNVHVFVHCHLFMQLDDVRSMLRLPLEDLGLTGGCNFAAPAILFNVLLGASQVLYSGGGFIKQGDRFKAFLFKQPPPAHSSLLPNPAEPSHGGRMKRGRGVRAPSVRPCGRSLRPTHPG
jgi:hypothetical protein